MPKKHASNAFRSTLEKTTNRGGKLLEELWGQLRMVLVLLWFFALLTPVALL